MLEYLICGHSRCQQCFALLPRCTDCVEGAAKRIEQVAMTEQDTERTRIILASELHLTSLTEQEQAEANEEAAHLVAADIPPLGDDGDAGGGGDDPDGAKGMIQESIKTGKVKITMALESARSGHVARVALNAALLLVPGDVEVGAAGPMDVDHQEFGRAPKPRKRGRVYAIDIAVVGCSSVLQPVVPTVVPLVLCGFTYHSTTTNEPKVCSQSAAFCGRKNHTAWRIKMGRTAVQQDDIPIQSSALHNGTLQ